MIFLQVYLQCLFCTNCFLGPYLTPLLCLISSAHKLFLFIHQLTLIPVVQPHLVLIDPVRPCALQHIVTQQTSKIQVKFNLFHGVFPLTLQKELSQQFNIKLVWLLNHRTFIHDRVIHKFTGPQNVSDLFVVILGFDPDHKQILYFL